MMWPNKLPPRSNTKQYLVSGLIVIGGLALLTLGGCLLPAAIYTVIRYPRGIEFIDAQSGGSRFVAATGLTREWLAGIGEDRESCLTLHREGDAIIARVRELDGQVRSERRLPLLTGPHPSFYENALAITRDLERVAFYDLSTKGIVLYDASTGRQKELFFNAGSTGAGVAFMRFLKNNQLLLVLNQDRKLERGAVVVLLIDTDTGSATSLLKEERAFWGTSDVAVSPSHRLAVISTRPSSDRLRQTIRVFDLASCQQVASISDSGTGFIYLYSVCFSPASQMIGWIRATNDGNAVMVSPLSGGSPRLVKLYPKDTRCTNLTFLDEQTLVLTMSEKEAPTKRLVAVNIPSGEERLYSEKAFWGKVLVAGERPVILCEMGY